MQVLRPDCGTGIRRCIQCARAFGGVFVLAVASHAATNEPASKAPTEGADAKPAAVRQGKAAETNFFVTFTASEFSRDVTPQKLEAARHASESRPAAQDPEGNWGELSEGFLLSVRFPRQTFKVGEPIVATVLIRNPGARTAFYRDFFGMGEDSTVCQFVVLDGQGKPVPRLDKTAPEDITDGPHASRELNPGTQRRYEVRLEQKFNLDAPGDYSVRARRWVHNQNKDGYSELKSGVATFRVVGG